MQQTDLTSAPDTAGVYARLAARRAAADAGDAGTTAPPPPAAAPAAASDAGPSVLARMFPNTAAVLAGSGQDAQDAASAGNYGGAAGQVARGAAALPISVSNDVLGGPVELGARAASQGANFVRTFLTGRNDPSFAAAPSAGPVATRATGGTGTGTYTPFEAAFPDSSSAAAPVPANVPSLDGQSGTQVAGAPGVYKFTQGGRTLYSNVPGSDSNDALLARGPVSARNQAALDGIQARQDAADTARANTAAFSQQERDAAFTNAQQGFGTGGVMDPRTEALAALSTGKLTKNGLAALLGIQQADSTAGTAAANLALARQKLGLEANKDALSSAEAQGVLSARLAHQRALQSGDPKAIEAAEANLRGWLGKFEKTYPELYKTIALPPAVGADGTKVPGGAITTDQRTGETKILSAADVSPNGGAGPGPVAGVQVGAATSQPDGTYSYYGKTLTVKGGKIASLQ